MLKIKTNKNKCKLNYIELKDVKITPYNIGINDDITITCENHCIKDNDIVVFTNNDGRTISFFQEVNVKKVIDDNIFTINGFGEYVLDVDSYKPTWIRYSNQIYGIPDDFNLTGATAISDDTILYLNNGDTVSITNETLTKTILAPYKNTLVSVSIGSNVRNIGSFAFSNFNISEIVIPDDVINIEPYAFYNCVNLAKVEIGNTVENIGDYAFSNCSNLVNVRMGYNIKTIGKSSFIGIHRIAKIYCFATTPPKLLSSEVFDPTSSLCVKTGVVNIYRGIYFKPTSFTTSIQEKYLCLTLKNKHIYTVNRDYLHIKRKYTWNGDSYTYDGAITSCDGDVYLFDDLFLCGTIRNNLGVMNTMNVVLTATTTGGETQILHNCLIGVTNDCIDDLYSIYIPFSEINDGFLTNFEDYFDKTKFSGDDIRFLRSRDSKMSYGPYLQNKTKIDKVCGDIEIDFGINENFETNLLKEEQVNNFIDEVKENSINKIIDYERYQFVPMYYTKSIPTEGITADEYLQENSDKIDGNLKRLSKIKFHLNFREKDFTLYENENGQIDYVDFGDWDTSDYGYWNNYTLAETLNKLEFKYPNKRVYGDLLGFLGFNDDDVYYQKDALKKSFLRLSFYDSPNKETQKLLYYSTIYFDTNSLAKKYVKDLNIWRENEEYMPTYGQLVFDAEITSLNGQTLTAEMACTDKYDDTLSSDGFYIHLFDKLVSGNTCTPIYMKPEFNNAKYGKLVPMICPVFKTNNERIPPTNTSFPREYLKYVKKDNGEIYTFVDMESLLNDMYIKIFIKYDYETNEYVWFLPRKEDSDVLTFELFEPRVVGYDPESYYFLEGNDVGYGTEDGTPDWFQGKFIYCSDENKYIWFREGNNDEKYSEFGECNTDIWPDNLNCSCLMTTATTLETNNVLKGTKLFNNSAIEDIKSIWIDGMMVYSNNVYDGNNYTTNTLQLPDLPFNTICINGYGDEEIFTWKPQTTQEVWDDDLSEWKIDEDVKPKKIHSVNYYFKNNIVNAEELINELYTGIYNKDKKKTILKTKEATEELINSVKASSGINNFNGQQLPKGMFSEVRSLRSIKIPRNNGHYFTSIGNGAFNHCLGLNKVIIEKDSVDIISKNTFSGCKSLKSVNLSNTKFILREAFQGCYTLTKVDFTLGNSAKTRYIASGAFGYTKIRSIIIPHTVKRLSNSVFRRTYQLNNVTIEENSELISIGKHMFSDSAILKYVLKTQRSSIGNSKHKYKYVGGTPDIIVDLFNKGDVKVEFYDATREKYVSLTMVNGEDRGKITSHFLDSSYRKYLDNSSGDVYNFKDWQYYLY